MRWLEYLRDLNMLSIALRILLSVFFGAVIGGERSRRNNPAGLRTHILVCLGSALVMTTSQYVCAQFGMGDLNRMGAQVVSGIGFLGAGTIILSGGKVKGLTTAAGLWATACIGLAIGIGFYEGALIGGLTIIVTLALLRNYSHKLTHRSPYISLYLLMEGIGDFNRLNGYLASVGAALQSVDFSPGNGCGGLLAVEIELMLPKAMTKETLVEGIDRIGGISAVNIE